MSVMPALKRVERLNESYSAAGASINLKPDCPYALTAAKAMRLSKERCQCMICCRECQDILEVLNLRTFNTSLNSKSA